jgi:serine/threonine protein kinase/tetratricopeptide (TPR) repeat protein
VSRCFQSSVADAFLHGRLANEEFTRALKHAAGCSDCSHLLFATTRPGADLATGSMDEIQERLTTWRAARRAPLMPAFPWRKGHEVDRYVIIRSVGGTEDGVIYEAFDPERDDRVVVKQLDLHIDDPATPELMTLAQKLGQLSHPGLLQMLSVGVHDGFVYFVYEFIKGTTLLEAGGEDPRQIIALFADAGRGLAAAHDVGISHGCFSATSCVVGRNGKVKVLDFGVGEARIHRVAATHGEHDAEWTSSSEVNSEDSFVGFVPSRQRSSTGQFESIILAAGPTALGPRMYAAPELVLGSPPSPASDQFAFCAALYHRLYGRPPYYGETISLWLRELFKGQVVRPPALPGVSPAVQAALLCGLERDPAARFDKMSTLVAKLRRNNPVSGTRRRTITAVAVGAAVAAAGGIAIATLRGGPGAASVSGCDRTLAGWDDFWSPSHQDELVRAAAAGAEALPALRARLDAWVDSWRTASHDFCRLPTDRPQVVDCAARARAIAGDFVQLVRDTPGRLTLATSAAEALPTYEQCASSAPSPAQAPVLVVKADLRRRLGLLDEADQLTAKPPEDPAQRGYRSLVRGHTAMDRGDLINARRLFEDATFEAHAAHQSELGITAALQRLALSCSTAERSLWTGYLEAQVHLADKTLQHEYQGALAQSFLCEGKVADAVKLRQQVARTLQNDQSATGAAASLDLARALLAQGALADAETAARNAATIYTQLYGARHPLARAARLALAEAQLPSTASRAAAEQAITEALGDLGPHKEPDALRARALLLLGALDNARGRRDEALRQVQRATQEYEAALGGTHPELASALLAAGDLLLAAGHDQEAEASYRQVAAILDTLGQSESVHLAHARAGIQLARWGNRPPPDATEILQWGLAPTGGTLDPAVAGWLAEQLGRRAAARGDHAAALAQYRAAAVAWQQAGDHRGLSSALTEGALLAVQVHDPDARAMLEEALQQPPGTAAVDKPRLQTALVKLLWPSQRDRARALARAALADLPESSSDAADLKQWLKDHHDGGR